MDGEVVGLRNVTLGDGSGRCCLHWKDTEISESNIRDKGLLEKFKEEAKREYGEEVWAKWVSEKASRGKRYGFD
jgi:hypothetical protein